MKPSILSGIAQFYLALAGIGYVILGLFIGGNDGSSASFILLVPAFFVTSVPSGAFVLCRGLGSSFFPICTSVTTISLGFMVLISVKRIRKNSKWIYVLYVLSVIGFTNALLNLFVHEKFSFAILTLINASLFLLATRVVHRKVPN